jgi:hypothetical protein
MSRLPRPPQLARLQEDGPSEEEVRTVVELEVRSYETGLQENGFWAELLLAAYQSRLYDGDVGRSFQVLAPGATVILILFVAFDSVC